MGLFKNQKTQPMGNHKIHITSWMLNSVQLHIAINLQAYQIAEAVWNYMKRVYHQENLACRFQLEFEVGEYSQGSKSIQGYYSGLWHSGWSTLLLFMHLFPLMPLEPFNKFMELPKETVFFNETMLSI